MILSVCFLLLSINADTGYQAGEAEYPDNTVNELSVISETVSISSPQNEFCLPRQVNLANAQRVQSTVKRTNSSSRQSCVILKDGKVINLNSTGYTERIINLFPSGLLEASHHFISLGKLRI